MTFDYTLHKNIYSFYLDYPISNVGNRKQSLFLVSVVHAEYIENCGKLKSWSVPLLKTHNSVSKNINIKLIFLFPYISGSALFYSNLRRLNQCFYFHYQYLDMSRVCLHLRRLLWPYQIHDTTILKALCSFVFVFLLCVFGPSSSSFLAEKHVVFFNKWTSLRSIHANKDYSLPSSLSSRYSTPLNTILISSKSLISVIQKSMRRKKCWKHYFLWNEVFLIFSLISRGSSLQ